MFKFLLIALAVIAVVTAVPAVRSRVVPPIGRALGPTGEKLWTPVKRQKAKSQCNNLLREIQAEATAGRKAPQPLEFSAWAIRELRDPAADTDPWGSKYYLKQVRGQISVGSPGPDKTKATTDDILVSMPWDR